MRYVAFSPDSLGGGLQQRIDALRFGVVPGSVREKVSEKREVGKEAKADILLTSQFMERCAGHEEPVPASA